MPATYTNNSADNVSTGRFVAGGYLLSIPRTAANLALIPSLKDTSTLPAFTGVANLGYISSDGVTQSISTSTETQNDVNGDPVNTSKSDRTETISFTLLELKKDTLAEAYGHGNVTDADGVIEALHNNEDAEHRIYVALLLLKNGRRWNKVIPDGQVDGSSEVTFNSANLIQHNLTVNCNTYEYDDGGTHKSATVIDYLDSTETTAPSNG